VYNGALLVGERLTGIRTLPDARLAPARRAATLLLVVLGWVLFRAASIGDAGDIYASMFSFDFGALPSAIDQALTPEPLLALSLGLASVLLPRDLVLGRVVEGRWAGSPLAARVAVVVVLPLSAIAVAAGSFSPFLYFQF
jgi:alginate O-acetyltransferase complex protein AlgI